MKTQMRFQKILTLVSLIIAALCLVYTVSFLTGGMANVHYYMPSVGGVRTDRINATNFVNASQNFVDTLLILSIVLILLVAALYATATNRRRNYYVTNYIAIAATVLFALAVAIYIIVAVTNVMNLFYNDIAWEAGTNGGMNYAEQLIENYPVGKSSANFVLGYILAVIVILDACVWVLNVLWKVKLMQGEKRLLAAGAIKEVA